ncbi:beta-mannosidase-like [Artemia franciscana]|uniref:beta-mannosidase-like n=1 Tax=Artemia franciscana TaxID=6661 RepID=UPI0032DAE4C0
MMSAVKSLLLLCSVAWSVNRVRNEPLSNIQDLTVFDWILKNDTSSYPAIVPGGVYTDLIRAGILDDLYYRFNDFAYRWVSYGDWSYEAKFTVDETIFQKQRILLVCDGLDTVADVFVNDQQVGSSDNMFVQYKFDIKDSLIDGENTLTFKFKSPVQYAKEQWDAQSSEYPVLPECVDPAYRGECHANHIRKMQASFAWDWGPSFPSVGIWKSIRLEGFDTLQLRDVLVFTEKQSEGWKLRLVVHMDTAEANVQYSGKIDLQVKDLQIQETIEFYTFAETESRECSTEVTVNVDVTPELWWPRGYGSQRLYEMSVTLQTSQDVAYKNLLFGFRTIELVQTAEEVDGQGLSFYFKINSVPIFLKGSNWIPSHILPENSTPEKLRFLVRSAAEANHNTLRIWGGGMFEAAEFYQAADELGLVIWHDFMFACSMYPSKDWFLSTVSAEIRHQVRRLQHHPSIIVWAGNNENEKALRDNWYGTNSNFELYKADYKKLYVETIRPIVIAEDSSRPFVVSSPSNGLASEEEDFVAINPGSYNYGDIHYYNYFMDAWDPKNFPIPRMATEYGFQAMPSFRSIKRVTTSDDWSYNSTWNDHVQHHPGGNSEMLLQVEMHLPRPSNIDAEEGFKQMTYLTQVNQAMSVKAETEWYRRWMGKLNGEGLGYTYGAMYWQLQDIWPGHSWASIEYDGNWKLLHYYSKDFFASILPIPIVEEGAVRVYISSDLVEPVNVGVQLVVQRYDSLEDGRSYSSEFLMPALSSELAGEWVLSTILPESGCDTPSINDFSCFIRVSLTGVSAPTNVLLLSDPKDAKYNKATISDSPRLQISEGPMGPLKVYTIWRVL